MRLLLSTLFTILSLSALAASASTHQPNDMQVRVSVEDKAQWQQLRRLGLDVVWVDRAYAEIITNPVEIETLTELGFKTEVIHESATEFYRSRLNRKDMGGYKTLAEINLWVDLFIADHPDIVSAKQSLGNTIEGRPIWAFKVSDNPNVDEAEPEVLFTAAIHAREVNTPEIIFYYLDYITDNYATDPAVKELVDSREIWIIPICNPDGYYHNQVIAPSGGGMWRLNRRVNGNGTFGVDLNRNFGYMWGFDDAGSSPFPGSPTYRGTGPFSEPETQHLRDFMIAHDFVLGIDWHQYSNITLFPWGYEVAATPDADLYDALGDSIFNMNGYMHGLVGEILYPVNGGSIDWEYGEQTLKNKMLGMTLEAGISSDGFWPTLSRAQVQREDNLEPMLFLTRLAGNIYSLRPPDQPEIVALPPSVDGAGYTVSWTHDDPTNPAVAYELEELQMRQVITDRGESLDDWVTDQFSVSTTRAFSSPSSIHSAGIDGASMHLQSKYPYLVAPGDQLTFRTFYDLELYYDIAYVEISTDGHTFESIPGNITSNFNPYGTNHGNGISGSSDDWVEASFDLSAYEGESIWIRFTYETDASQLGEGLYLDDIYPHLIFDQESMIASNLTEQTFTFYGKPLGVYYYQVRAQDAENQWSLPSEIERLDVLNTGGTADLNLDGITGSIADLTLYNLYFLRGVSVFDVYIGTQVGQTDINCDATVLTVDDVNTLTQIVIGSQVPCYGGKAATDPGQSPSATTGRPVRSQTFLSLAADEAAYTVELQSTSFDREDSAWVDVTLTSAASGLIGFQFHLQFDAASLTLDDVRWGDDFSNWQSLGYNQTTVADQTDVIIAGVAWSMGATITETDIDPLPLPTIIVRLKFGIVSSDQPLVTDVNFVWTGCGDNGIVAGTIEGPDLVMDSLVLSRLVYDADGIDVTGLEPTYGGADYTCFFDQLGNTPAAAVDFKSGRITYDPSCCVGQVGDVNAQGGDEPTIGDISTLVDHLFISGVELGCLPEADINQSGGSNPSADDITIGDISTLIDNLFISGAPLLDCL